MARSSGDHKRKLIHAFHEASHACVALALDVDVDCLSIEPSNDGAGGHILYRRGNHDAWSFQHRRLIITLAGPCGQRVHSPRSAVRYNGTVDFEDARKITRSFSSSPMAAASLYRWAEDQARTLVQREWLKIKAVASALMERRTLSGDDLKAITEPVGQSQSEALERICAMLRDDRETMDALQEQVETDWRRRRPVHRGDVAAAMLRVMLDVLALGDHIELSKIKAATIFNLVMRGFDEDSAREKVEALVTARAPFVGWTPVTVRGQAVGDGRAGGGSDAPTPPAQPFIHQEEAEHVA